MIAVVIPAYKVRKHILSLIPKIGSMVKYIYVVDDKCPEKSGKYVEDNCKDNRVKVVYNNVNKGVGGAVKAGYKEALKNTEVEIIIKLDGDGQMNPDLIPKFAKPIQEGKADYVKGNRFFNLEKLHKMPKMRLIGNSALSLGNKFVNGYWNTMDPTNGYTAIHKTALSFLPLDKIDNRYFFESDMLFRLGTIRAVVFDQPMDAHYDDEESSLSIKRVLIDFPPKYINRYFKRIFYNYFLRDFNVASIELIFGILLFAFGTIKGVIHWADSVSSGFPATSGTVMLAALPVILGFQLLLSALNFDIQHIPKQPLQQKF